MGVTLGIHERQFFWDCPNVRNSPKAKLPLRLELGGPQFQGDGRSVRGGRTRLRPEQGCRSSDLRILGAHVKSQCDCKAVAFPGLA